MLAQLLYLTCFQQTAQIIGYQQQTVLYLHLSQAENAPALCKASEGTQSIAIIHYGSKSIENQFLYKEQTDIAIEFDLHGDSTKFMEVFDNLIIQYEVKLALSLQVKGPVQNITLIKLNISNCWQNIELIYQRIPGQEFIEMSGMPILCTIIDPKVQFQYQVNGEWQTLDILGSKEGNGYYDSTIPYVYSDVLFYKQSLNDLIDDKQKEILQEFFINFQRNRTIQTRFLFTTNDYNVIAIISRIESQNFDCILNLNPSGFLTSRYIDIGMDNKDFSSSTKCVSNATTIQSSCCVITQIGIFCGIGINDSLEDFSARNGFVFNFLSNLQDFHKILDAQVVLYITAYDINGDLILESSYQNQVITSCIDFIDISLSQIDGGCAALNYYNTDKCLNREPQQYNLTFTSQLNGSASRTTFFSYMIMFNPSTIITKKCSKVLTQRVMGQNSTLPLNRRYNAYRAIAVTENGLYIALSDDSEFINWDRCNLGISRTFLLYFALICTVIFISIIIIVLYQVKQLQ
ncbi:hypothetical protein SS50377_27053 [Spironucleus salmonicida]|uniref:Transmembrane protein n=1 Tax=Spironucleus salmonicida TaxID=348837 RepID=V6M3Z3_9EUKA|nr:hypothetical protein SS50377_27053 [Spironucleus salmonicida]|eukprot:EST48039.1 Hypothetical protein SS50377_11804 [Spironucleus salmonicida]